MKNISVSKIRLQIGFKGLVNSKDESLLDTAYSPHAYNYTFEGGVLKSNIGITDAMGYYSTGTLRHLYDSFAATDKIVSVFAYYKRTNGAYDDRIVVLKSDNSLWYTKIFAVDTWHKIENVSLDGHVCAVNYNYNGDDVLLLSSECNYPIMLNDTTATMLSNAPKFSSLAVHNERIYGSVNGDTNQVWFSDDFNPTNWAISTEEAGYITFSDECGDVLKVVSFLNYLYIFREHGIFRLTAYGDQTYFFLKKKFTNTGRIYEHTISSCGDKIIFLAEEGLFVFDGYNIMRIAEELPTIYYKQIARGAYHNNCYYLACQLILPECMDADGILSNTLIRYDIRDKSIAMLAPCDLCDIVSVNVHNATDLLCVFRTGHTNKLGMICDFGTIMGANTFKHYESPENILLSDKLKTVRDFTLMTKYPIKVRVLCDGKPYEYELSGSPYEQKVFVEKSGYKIGFEIDATWQYTYLTPLIVNVDLSN